MKEFYRSDNKISFNTTIKAERERATYLGSREATKYTLIKGLSFVSNLKTCLVFLNLEKIRELVY